MSLQTTTIFMHLIYFLVFAQIIRYYAKKASIITYK